MTKILIAEDDEEIRWQLTSMLERRGAKVVAVANGQEALLVLQQQGPFDLLMTDNSMPQKNDGLSLIKEVRRQDMQDASGNPLPIHMNSNDRTVEAEARAAGANDFTYKLATANNDLAARISKLIGIELVLQIPARTDGGRAL